MWKWGFLCYCFTKWSSSPQSSSYLINPSLCHLQHTLTHTHTRFCLTCRQPPPPVHPPVLSYTYAETHSTSHLYRVCGTDGGVVEVLSVLHVCLVHSQLTHSPMSTSVATTVPVTAPWTHLQPSKHQVLPLCVVLNLLAARDSHPGCPGSLWCYS